MDDQDAAMIAVATNRHEDGMWLLGFGICGVVAIILAVLWVVVWYKKRGQPLIDVHTGKAKAEVIDVVAVETTSTAITHHVDSQGRKVCRFCGGHSPTWYRPRMLVLVEGVEAWIRARWRVPPAWRIEDVPGSAQDICARHHLIEGQGLAKRIEDIRRKYEETTEQVMLEHQAFSENFHAELSGKRSWHADTF